MPSNPLTFIPLLLFTLLTTTSAFDVHMYTSKSCTGSAFKKTLNIPDGCSTYGAGVASSFIMPWTGNQDNNQLLVTYSDENCCHASKIEAYGWTDDCTPFGSQGVKSWRVVDPIQDPDKGKSEEIEGYKCQKCGKDQCGTVNGGLIPNLPRGWEGEGDENFNATLVGEA